MIVRDVSGVIWELWGVCVCCVGVFDNPTCSGWETHPKHFLL